MDTIVVLAAIASAAMHAAWNAAVRASGDPANAFGAQVFTSGLWGLLLLPFVGLPAPAALPWFAASVALNVVAMRAIVAAYARAPFAIVYPLARGLYPPLLFVIGIGLFAEVPSSLGLVGLGLVSVAILLLTLLARAAGRSVLIGAGWAAFAAGITALYVACDVAGARAAGSWAAYAVAISIANGVVFVIVLTIEGKKPFAFMRARPGFAIGWSAVSMTSYLLVLYAFTVAPAALVAALRETSVLFATAYAAFLLKEPLKPLHWIASGIAVAGVIAIRMG